MVVFSKKKIETMFNDDDDRIKEVDVTKQRESVYFSQHCYYLYIFSCLPA